MRLKLWLLVVAGGFLVSPAWAQPVPSAEPSSTHIFPAGGRRGTVVKVRVGGECWPPGMHFNVMGSGLTGPTFLGPEVNARYEPSLRRTPRDADAVGSSMSYPREFDATLAIAADAELGTRLWRVWGGWGGTRPRPFLVGDLPEFIETEPNSRPELAERISLPVVINGQIAGERDQDFFVFHASAGAVVVCDAMAARIGSPLEPVLAITDARGKRLEVDELRVGTDPVIAFRAAADGDYRLHVANLSFYGGPAYVYRITITTAACALFAFPAGGRAGATSDVEVFTPNGTGGFHATKQRISFPPQPGPFRLCDNLDLVAGTLPEVVETADDHASFESAMELTLPVTVNARFLKADEDDWYGFTAKKDEVFSITCQPWPRASAAVPALTLFDSHGVPLARASSAETPERGLEMSWKAPADGSYRLRLRDLQHGSRGGPEFIYRLTVRPAQPSFSLRLEADYVNVVQGGKAAIDLEVTRAGGFTGPIDLAAGGLPQGVHLKTARIADNQTRIKLDFAADADARPVDGVVRLVGTAAAAGHSAQSQAVTSSFGLEGDAFHLTVQHKPVFRLSCKETYQYAPRGSIHPYLMKIERFDGFDGPIVLQLCDRQVQDLDGVDVLETVIPSGVKEVMNRIYFPETMHSSVQAHSRPYAQAYTTFTDKWGQKQVLLSVSTHRCMVRTLPPVAKLRAVTKEILARPGEVAECALVLDRTTFLGPADVVLAEGAGCKAEAATMKGGQSEIVVRVHVSDDNVEGRVLRFRATGVLESGDTVVTEASVPLRFKQH
jgi:hypothetical protein